MQPEAMYEENWELARQRAKAANVSVGEWRYGVVTYDEKRKRDLADFRASCHRSLEHVKNGKGIPFNPDIFLEEAKPTFRYAIINSPQIPWVEFSPAARNDLAESSAKSKLAYSSDSWSRASKASGLCLESVVGMTKSRMIYSKSK